MTKVSPTRICDKSFAPVTMYPTSPKLKLSDFCRFKSKYPISFASNLNPELTSFRFISFLISPPNTLTEATTPLYESKYESKIKALTLLDFSLGAVIKFGISEISS